jgi:hygromycin-B 7''-O-kinase
VARFPSGLDPVAFDERYRLDVEGWRPAVQELCAEHGVRADPFEPFADGSNLVAAVGGTAVVKVFPPFHRNQWESEHRVLAHLGGRLSIPIPRLIAAGDRPDGWSYVILGRLAGATLESTLAHLAAPE